MKKFSLKTKIILMVNAVILFMAGGALLDMREVSSAYKKRVSTQYKTLAEDMGNRIGAQFFERYGDVQAFALNPIIKSLDPEMTPDLLDSYVKLYGIYDLILVVDKNGKFVASNNTDAFGNDVNHSALSSVDYSTAPWFKAVMSGQTSDDKEKGFIGTYFEDFTLDPHMKTAFDEARPTSSFSTKIENAKGEVVGVITNRAGFRWVEAEFKLSRERYAEEGHTLTAYTLLNKAGQVIFYYNPAAKKEIAPLSRNLLEEKVEPLVKAAKGETGTMYFRDPDSNATEIYGYHFVNNSKWLQDFGWMILVQEDESEAFAEVHSAMFGFYVVAFIMAALGMAIAVWFGMNIGRSLNKMTEDLKENSGEILSQARSMAGSSTELSEAATEQAAALQETVAAIDEINAMVEKNVESANRSKEVSSESRETAARGKNTVDSMLNAMSEINNSNEQIADQISRSHAQLSEITKLITDIGSKTKVINEIVFQTKLLSFNASVEAARAGEYGKGFAVVAEEVGNLAQMSGNAAKEITTLLDESVRKVDEIVSDTKSKVEKLITDSRSKVHAGETTARECSQVLDEIINGVSSVDTMVSEIAVASQEQATGIKEISKAIGQMEQVTQQNTSVAQASSANAEELNATSSELDAIIGSLVQLVHGNSRPSLKEVPLTPLAPVSSKILKLEKKKRPVQPKYREESAIKMVSNHDYVPSANDSGFDE